jgi:putative oxidoreductase
MERILGRFAPRIFAITRIIAGLMFAMHGTQKLFGWPPREGAGGGGGGLPPLMLAGGVIELVCGLMIAIGLFAGLAAFIASGEMAVAYFMVHAKGGFWPIVNQGELAVMYCFFFLFVAAHGAGVWSVDAMRGGHVAGFRPNENYRKAA